MTKTRDATHNGFSSALLSWEDAGESLATSLSTYLQSCAFLESFSSTQNVYEKNMAARIDNSLKNHSKLFNDLTQSRVIIARMRNKISSRPYSLPTEILAEIFINVVYVPGPKERRHPEMADALKRIFARLHCLLAVCSTWRSVAMEFSGLWSVIPAANGTLSHSTSGAVCLALQRSRAWTPGNRPLHLGAVLLNNSDPIAPFKDNMFPPFTSVNIEARYESAVYDISDFLEVLLGRRSSSVLSELSIHQYHDPLNEPWLQRSDPDEFLGIGMSAEGRHLLTRLIGSLSAFRLRNINVRWETFAFSDKLVELHLQSVVLGDSSKLAGFLHVLESAPELRDLRLISVVVSSSDWNVQPETTSLPKLQSLLLTDLTFNVLEHVLTSIAPGSHRIKVALTPQSEHAHHRDEDSNPDENNLEEMCFAESGFGSRELFNLLGSSNVDTILFDLGERESPWVHKEELRRALELLPNLKTLVMNDWKWDLGSILALERPRSNKPFPNLTKLCILGGDIADAHLLPRVALSHPLQTLVLGSIPSTRKDGGWEQIEQSIRRAVPDFRVIGDLEMVHEFSYDSWRLW
ncbi:hypothetical protein RSOL_362250 [Rhizoctonia solani AG-3 Rhs1AP]|uniref:F-box-like domain protein n=1 Tax=Rhizoctonia solani AG-3 Rhs1AP TaxID=1086054 RepID=X8JAT9_9AGAM|nr:hypothetical protein RSOL_362250 [Rhizoctonia solani AG-3 Rhs1AP]